MIKSFKDIISSKKQFKGLSNKRANGSVFDFLRLVDSWEDVAGKAMSHHTIPFKFENGILFITSSHPAFAQTASFNQKALIAKIYKSFPELEGRIKRLYFKLDAISFSSLSKLRDNRQLGGSPELSREEKKVSEIPHRHSPEYQLAEIEAKEMVKDLDDEDFKELLIEIYIQQKFED